MSTVDIKALEDLVLRDYLTVREHPTLPLYIWNYTAKAQYDRAWTPETLMCRGLITDHAGTIVARCMPKFFNWEEHIAMGGTIPVEPFMVTRKLDGSMFLAAMHNGTLITATRGSFLSEQAEGGRQILREKYSNARFAEGFTYIFEYLAPENRIVVDYGNTRDLVLLAVINTVSGEEVDVRSREWPFPVVPQWHEDGVHHSVLFDHLKDAEQPNEEGFVVRFESGLRLKVKFESYKKLHAVLTNTSSKTIWVALSHGEDVSAILDGVPDEFSEWVQKIARELTQAKEMWQAEVEKVFNSMVEYKTRKDFALASAQHPFRSALFLLLDGKPIEMLAWKAVEPELSYPFRE